MQLQQRILSHNGFSGRRMGGHKNRLLVVKAKNSFLLERIKNKFIFFGCTSFSWTQMRNICSRAEGNFVRATTNQRLNRLGFNFWQSFQHTAMK